jgi:lysylphosphatidylglycerol synthetase-like protein (DUF2156 family)
VAEQAPDQQSIAAAIAEVSDHLTLLVREEIELAKSEVTTKVTKLAKGLFVAAVAGIFLLLALAFALHGAAWLLWYELPTGSTPNYFWGFFALAAILVLLACLAGFIAYRAVRAGTPPTPQMAIEEARKIRETVGTGAEGSG